jgi:hypothetical protein
MRLTILTGSGFIAVDNIGYHDFDLSWIPEYDGEQVHAVQWYEDHGEIEFRTTVPNLDITELGIYQKAVAMFQEKHATVLEEEKKVQELFAKSEAERLEKEKQLEEELAKYRAEYEDSFNIEDILSQI